jgi:hypothetical protein
MSGVGFRLASGFSSRGGDFATICYAALVGVILLALTESHPEQYQRLMNNPIEAGVGLAIGGFVLGFILGTPIGWIRRKLI